MCLWQNKPTVISAMTMTRFFIRPLFAHAARWPSFMLHAFGCLAVLAVLPAAAAEVGLAGVFPGKALLTINGGAPRTVSVGTRTEDGVLVVSVDRETATLEINGKKQILRVGQNVAAQTSASGPQTAVLAANAQGHFLTTGSVNGSSVRFLVDTGASMIALGMSQAKRLGIDTARGEQILVNTANGQVVAAKVKLDTVKVGEIVVHGVDAMVHPSELPFALLGMSFLNRMEMQRDGDTMTLKKRF